MMNRSQFVRLARRAYVVAAAVTGSVFGFILLRVVVGGLFGEQIQMHWMPVARISILIGAAVFALLMVQGLAGAGGREKVPRMPRMISKAHAGTQTRARIALPGFLAMERVWLVLNRTFVVFIAPEGLYGWCVQGLTLRQDPDFFEPYEDVLEDEEFASNHAGIERLSRGRGGFFLPRAQVRGVELHRRPSWQMGQIPHSGSLHLRLSGGGQRELALLGLVNGESICDCIVSVLAVPLGSKR